MPFSALSPEGPVSLRGADPTTVENLRSRNRQEACFTAKCCGAPLTIRTAPGKSPHFVHKVVPRNCDGDRHETPEHERLKSAIAAAAEKTYEWDVETEAVHRDPQTQQVLWRADVLASKRKAHVAFEVQLSNADYEVMRVRQARYRETGVRGLWFVRTKKGFPVGKELPIFTLEAEPAGDWVRLLTAWDYPFIAAPTGEAESMELSEFVQAALDGNLKWAPFEDTHDAWLHAYVDYSPGDPCPQCQRIVVQPFCVRARMAGVDTYPEFQFARGLGGFRRTSGWYDPLLKAVWAKVRDEVSLTMRSAANTCTRCSASLGNGSGRWNGGKTAFLATNLQLKDLPKPRFGTVEQAWLRRWAVIL